MHKRYLPITIATAVLFLTALAGYMIPAHPDEMPVRTLMENKGGKVILNHVAHADLADGQCGTCHHTTGNDPRPPACGKCHVGKFDDAFKANHPTEMAPEMCVSCHHRSATVARFMHDEHADDYLDGDCQTCHHDPSIEPTPQACSNCHMDGSNSVIRLRDAAHERCAECHIDMYQDGLDGCHNCHERAPASVAVPEQQACSDCHDEPLDQLVPTSMNAFHAKCMGCHEELGAGPFGDDACDQCHMK